MKRISQTVPESMEGRKLIYAKVSRGNGGSKTRNRRETSPEEMRRLKGKPSGRDDKEGKLSPAGEDCTDRVGERGKKRETRIEKEIQRGTSSSHITFPPKKQKIS